MPNLQLNERTLLPLGLVLMLVSGALALQSWLNVRLNAIENEIKLSRIESKNYWTVAQMAIWGGQLREKNTNLFVPDPFTIPFLMDH